MRFALDGDQQDIQRTARELLTSRVGIRQLHDFAARGRHDEALWRELCEQGWLGVATDHEFGGLGLGTVELVSILAELGYSLAPVPVLSTVAAATMIARAGSHEQCHRWLPLLATGEARGALGWRDRRGTYLATDLDGAAFVIVVEGARARLLTADEYSITARPSLDLSRPMFTLDPHGLGNALPGDIAEAHGMVGLALAAESLGVARRAMDLAVEYAKIRSQYGQKIGSYQAISHRCVQMLLNVEEADANVMYAAWCADNAADRAHAAAAVASFSGREAGWHVPASAMQVFGGIGFTWEHIIHLFLRRGRANAALFGSSRESTEVIADLMLDRDMAQWAVE